MLPSELKPDSTEDNVEKEKERIRNEIIGKPNSEIAKSKDTMTLLRGLGSDLNINAFALNFKNKDGSVNKDVEEANDLNRRVVKRFSVVSPDQDTNAIPFYLTSTEFSHELYGSCVENFKKRLQLSGPEQTLFVLRNVVMSPFPTTRLFFKTLIDGEFRKVVQQEVDVSENAIIGILSYFTRTHKTRLLTNIVGISGPQ